MNLYEIMRSAGGGDAFAALAKQCGLSEEEIAKAVAAFLPAFSVGLKRNTADPFGFMELMRQLALGGYAQAYRSPGWAFGAGRREGEDALAFLFGSPEAGRAVAEQAAVFTGLAQEKLKDLLPALTAMMLGGLARQSAAANPMLDAMLKGFRAGDGGAAPAGKGPLDRYEEEQERAAGQEPGGDLARMQEQMMQAGLAAFQTGTAAWQQAMGEMMKSGGAPPGAAASGVGASGRDLFGEMFEPGVRLSEAYRKEMEALLDRFAASPARK